MSATIFNDVAEGFVDTVDAAAITLKGRSLKTYDYEGQSGETVPYCTIDGPSLFRRAEPEEADIELGTDGWYMEYTVRLYVDQPTPEIGATDARSLLGQLVAAVDADKTLSGSVNHDAALYSGEMLLTEGTNREMIVYECTLAAIVRI